MPPATLYEHFCNPVLTFEHVLSTFSEPLGACTRATDTVASTKTPLSVVSTKIETVSPELYVPSAVTATANPPLSELAAG